MERDEVAQDPEVLRVREVYGRRASTTAREGDPYRIEFAHVMRSSIEIDRVLHLLLRSHFAHRRHDELSAVELGCGIGNNLLRLLRLGFDPSRLTGVEINQDRARQAAYRLPGAVTITTDDARTVQGTFDLALQFLLLSSVLNSATRRQVAENMWHLVRPGGAIVSYDFVYDNPRNPDVAKVTRAQLARLFPDGHLTSRSVTVAPPVARALDSHPLLLTAASLLRPIKSHRLVLIRKPS